jgi:16S rRNA (guanine1207-N2)-methyltransferase
MDHYYSEKPASSPKDITIKYTLNSHIFTFFTSTSVFSKDKVDRGTDLLIRESKITPNAKILDIGCGYGAVGIVIGALQPYVSVTMSDINERALALAKRNSEFNEVNATLLKSYLFENIRDTFDIVLSNPPNSAGKQLCFQLIEQSFEHLNKGGSLQLVVMKKKGGKELAKKMDEVFGNVETIGREAGYHLYYSERK